jgi:hypothetical protein
VFVEHAIGSLERPMSDDELARKFQGLVDPILGAAKAGDLIAYSMRIASADNLRSLTALARPALSCRGELCDVKNRGAPLGAPPACSALEWA